MGRTLRSSVLSAGLGAAAAPPSPPCRGPESRNLSDGGMAGWRCPACPSHTASLLAEPHRDSAWPWQGWGSFLPHLRPKVSGCEAGRKVALSPVLARSLLSPQSPPAFSSPEEAFCSLVDPLPPCSVPWLLPVLLGCSILA